MKFSDWNEVYSSTIRSILSMMNAKRLRYFKYTKDNIIRLLEVLNLFDTELFDKYYNFDKLKFKMSFKDFEYLCKKYIKVCKKENNLYGSEIFFNILVDVRSYFKHESEKYILNSIDKFITESTIEEREYAERTFPHDNFSFLDDYTKIMIYKGLKIYVFLPFDVGFIYDNNKVKQFDLTWDWWYPIDHYIYIDKQDKNDKIRLF